MRPAISIITLHAPNNILRDKVIINYDRCAYLPRLIMLSIGL